MASEDTEKRYIFKTHGVCPPEIHFTLEDDILREVRFVGGGCPGNAKLASRFLKDRAVSEVVEQVRGIPCRNGTSCPDQLGRALAAVREGALTPAASFRIFTDPDPRRRIAILPGPAGDAALLDDLLDGADRLGADGVYCMGDLTGAGGENPDILRRLRKRSIPAVLGDRDWARVQESGDTASDWRDRLAILPQVVSFHLSGRSGVFFHGGYLRDLPGFSDYEPYALEINMVCDLTDYLRDAAVFPALEAMIPQFSAGLVVFGHHGGWRHIEVGGVHFVGIGEPVAGGAARIGLLTGREGSVAFEIHEIPGVRGKPAPGEEKGVAP